MDTLYLCISLCHVTKVIGGADNYRSPGVCLVAPMRPRVSQHVTGVSLLHLYGRVLTEQERQTR